MKPQRHLLPAIAALTGISAASAAPLPPIGNWQGQYRCAQGRTALDLAITAITPSDIRAVFYFHAVAANPAVPQGCFTMQGTFDAGTGIIKLAPASWLDRPASFVSVGLRGKVSASGRSIQGMISGPACAGFSLHRASAAPVPPAPAPCRVKQQGPVV
jgi:hypothetical protein